MKPKQPPQAQAQLLAGPRALPLLRCLLCQGQIHTLLIHALGLDALDQAEKVFVGHGGSPGDGVGGGTALVIDPGGLQGGERALG